MVMALGGGAGQSKDSQMTIRPTLRKPGFLRLFLLSALMLLALPGAANAAVSTLYAVTGSGGGTQSCSGTPSALYTLDPTTGAATLVGNVTVGTQVRNV